ncbi:MAG TPA: hypothetical protein VKB14_04625 [Actinomycetales bacterium]|nr:hypothetical protein [Actinomycetales bacterium]
MAAHDYPPMLGLVADGVLLPGLLVTMVLPLAGGGAALAAMDDPTAGAAGMTLLDPSR